MEPFAIGMLLIGMSLVGFFWLFRSEKSAETQGEAAPPTTVQQPEDVELLAFLCQFGERYMAAKGRAQIVGKTIRLPFPDHVEVLDGESGEFVWRREEYVRPTPVFPIVQEEEEDRYEPLR